MDKAAELIPIERIQNFIFLIRSEKVMLDSHLAELYGVETKALNRAVKRNANRFPSDFMFQISKEELENLRFQIGTSSLESADAVICHTPSPSVAWRCWLKGLTCRRKENP